MFGAALLIGMSPTNSPKIAKRVIYAGVVMIVFETVSREIIISF